MIGLLWILTYYYFEMVVIDARNKAFSGVASYRVRITKEGLKVLEKILKKKKSVENV